MSWLAARICRRKDHDWLLGHALDDGGVTHPPPGKRGAEFIPVDDICLRCGARAVTLPWGQCLNGHPLAEHYDDAGGLVSHPTCPGPS